MVTRLVIVNKGGSVIVKGNTDEQPVAALVAVTKYSIPAVEPGKLLFAAVPVLFALQLKYLRQLYGAPI